MLKLRLLAALLLTGLFLAACSDSEDNAGNGENQEAAETEETEQGQQSEESGQAPAEAAVMEEDEVVAVVNGEEIMGDEYNLAYSSTEQVMQQQGQQDITAGQLKEQTVATLIDQELIRQDAEEKGIEADEEEVNKNLEEVKSQFENEEQYQEELEKSNISEELLKSQVAYSIMLEKYMETEVEEPEVTDEDVQNFYDQISQQGGEVPELEEIEDQLREQLVQQEQQQQISSIIDELREDSEIEKKV